MEWLGIEPATSRLLVQCPTHYAHTSTACQQYWCATSETCSAHTVSHCVMAVCLVAYILFDYFNKLWPNGWLDGSKRHMTWCWSGSTLMESRSTQNWEPFCAPACPLCKKNLIIIIIIITIISTTGNLHNSISITITVFNVKQSEPLRWTSRTFQPFLVATLTGRFDF